MRNHLKSLVAGVVTLGVAGVMIAAGTGVASAAPPGYTDPGAYGTITFYDATGNVVTSGNAKDPLSTVYAVASTNPTTTVTTKLANLSMYSPDPTSLPATWTGIQLNTNTAYPITTAPAVVSGSTFPATAMTAASSTFFNASQAFVANTAAGYQNQYQLRLKTNTPVAQYAATSIIIDPVTGIWQQSSPVVPYTTTTTLAVTPSSPQGAPANLTLTANLYAVMSTPVGSVQFFNGTTAVGAPVPVTPLSLGIASMPLASVPGGTYSYTAKFTPTDPTAFTTSTSSAVPYTVSVIPGTSVALGVDNSAPTVGSPVNFTANLTPATAPGTIQFFDGATSLAPAAAPVAGVATLATSALAVGSHPVTAKFVPTDPTAFQGSTSSVVTVNVQAVLAGACATTPANCTDAQPFTVTVPVGSLIISTPWIVGHPFNLGNLAMNTAGTELTTGPVLFGSATNPTDGVTITDQRAGSTNTWTASLSSSAFTLGTNSIAPKELGFTGVTPQYITGNALTSGVVTTPNPAFSILNPTNNGLALSVPFATKAAPSNGTVYVTGTFTLNAPTSTPAGIYTGTVTFTIA